MASTIGLLIGIILALVIIGVIWWGVLQLLPLVTRYLAEPFITIIRVLVAIIMVLIVVWVIVALLGIAGVHVPNPFR
jgi:hypothetical protein